MELRQIRYFMAVAEEGNFSAASKRLFVSQPPVTRQIQQLEAELGVKLFERTQKGAVLTPAGEAFLEEARQIMVRTRLAAERSRAVADGEIGNLEIAYFGSPIYSVIPNAIRAFREQYATVMVSLQPMSKREQVVAVKDGRVHIGFSRYYPHDEKIEIMTVAHEKLFLATAAENPLTSRQRVTLKQLMREHLILFPKGGRPSFADEVMRILRAGGSEPQVEHETADLSSALALTAAGLGVCPVPDSIVHLNWPNIRFLRMQGVTERSPINCIYSASNQSPILQKFLETLRSLKR